MPDIDIITWYAFGIPLYVVYVVVEYVLARRRPAHAFTVTETISNLSAGLGTLLVGLFAGPWVVRAWDLVHDHVAPVRWPSHGMWRLPAAIVLADFCFYIYHRAGHRFALFWAIHGIHHQHERLNSSVAFRFEWLADPFAALFFGLMPLCGVDSSLGFAALALLSLYAMTTHSPVLPRPTWGVLVTPAIHGSHHSRDARFAEKNFGAMLGIWDHMFCTWLEPARGDLLRTDLPSVCRTHNGVKTQFELIVELVGMLRGRNTLLGKLRLLTSRPAPVTPPTGLREDAEIARPTRLYVLLQFLALVPISGWVLWFRDARPLHVQIACAVTVITGLYTLGALLDGHARAIELERIRLVGTALVGIGFVLYAPMAGVALLGPALVGFAGSFFLVPSTGESQPGAARQ